MTQKFDNWTAYDEWLIQNYSYYDITAVNEAADENGDKKIVIEYKDKPGAEKKPEE